MMLISTDDFILFMIACTLGGGLTFLFLKNEHRQSEQKKQVKTEFDQLLWTEKLNAKTEEIEQLNRKNDIHEKQLQTLQSDKNALIEEKTRLIERSERIDRIEKEISILQDEKSLFIRENAELNQQLIQSRDQAQKDLSVIENARKELTAQFEVLAQKILEDKSKKFTDLNQVNLAQILTPLAQNLTDFRTKVEEAYDKENKNRNELAGHVKTLIELNNHLSENTQNLTLALKGDSKAQGNWGEIILDTVLEKAGLVKDIHYERQTAVKAEDGINHVIPDVVLKLPGERFLIIDSKMTLPDYRAFSEAETDEIRTTALKRHLQSIRSHIKGLSEKNYQKLYDLKSLDFVVMFVPLEPAFMLAVTHDADLFQNAWEKNVLLVSPSTLLFVVRTVAYLWRQEDLSRNAKDISARGAELYDKLVSFVTDLQKVGERLDQAQSSYHDARKKLSEGQGNVVRQAEMLKKLGVKPAKALPSQWIDASRPSQEDET